MLLKKLFLRWQLKRLLKSSKGKSQKQNRSICEKLLNGLNPTYFETYKPINGLSTIVLTQHPNIEEYTSKLKQTILLIKQDTPIPPTWLNNNEELISLDRFLVTMDGYYIDVVKAVTVFRNTALELCILMRDSDSSEHGLKEHNLRMLTKLFINLKELIIKLIEVSVH